MSGRGRQFRPNRSQDASAPPGAAPAAAGDSSRADADRYGFPAGLNPASFFDANAEDMFKNMAFPTLMTGGRGIVRKVVIPEKEK
jgi:hypothetical protein